MKIAVLSGKGGTGKTFISTNLAWAIDNSTYVDCDIEEPNGHLFLKPKKELTKEIKIDIPEVDSEKCKACGECVDFCKFNALAHTGEELLIFEDVCHSCNGCILFCPNSALSPKKHVIGAIEIGTRQDIEVQTGVLNVGETSGTPIIDALVDDIKNKENVVIDCPPGSACTVMDSIEGVDYCILVLEPTVFGMENFKTIERLVNLYKKPFGVIINKYYERDNIAREYCLNNNIDILLEIPYSEEVGKFNSNALIISEENYKYKEIFKKLYEDIKRRYGHERVINT